MNVVMIFGRQLPKRKTFDKYLKQELSAYQKEISNLSTSELSHELGRQILSYRKWVNQNFKPDADWIHEVSEISLIREKLHLIYGISSIGGKKNSAQITKLDKRWQEFIETHKDDDFIEAFHGFRPGKVAKSHWWFWLDRLDQLSKKERSAL